MILTTVNALLLLLNYTQPHHDWIFWVAILLVITVWPWTLSKMLVFRKTLKLPKNRGGWNKKKTKKNMQISPLDRNRSFYPRFTAKKKDPPAKQGPLLALDCLETQEPCGAN